MSLFRQAASWVVGEIPTAAKLNTEIRDMWNALQGGSSTWQPVLLANGTSNPQLGSQGFTAGRVFRVGQRVFARGVIGFDGTGITAGNGQWIINLPIPADNSIQITFGEITVINSAGWMKGIAFPVNAGAGFSIRIPNSATTSLLVPLIHSSTPGGAALADAGSRIWFTFDYEAQ